MAPWRARAARKGVDGAGDAGAGGVAVGVASRVAVGCRAKPVPHTAADTAAAPSAWAGWARTGEADQGGTEDEGDLVQGARQPVMSFLGRLPTATIQFGSVLLVDRHGQRTALAITALVAGALSGLPTPLLAVLDATAGATVPQIGPLARARLIAMARRAAARSGR
ncbi:hypothetical protein [Streptomyces sp. NPDC001652]|uniref:hypothetical protein n=1 Tax=Streptomyces sp. NPDC001652 TaxID=3154393 RepID=UPI00331E6C10